MIEAWRLVSKIEGVFPELLQTLRLCPDPSCDYPDDPHSVWYLVTHLNDEHHWDRNRIADWLEHEAAAGNVDLSFKVES